MRKLLVLFNALILLFLVGCRSLPDSSGKPMSDNGNMQEQSTDNIGNDIDW